MIFFVKKKILRNIIMCHKNDAKCADASSNYVSECKHFDRKSAMPLIEQKYQRIAKDIEGFPVDIIADLLSNSVGSEKSLTAVKKAKDYAALTGTRFIVAAADLEVLLDTFKAVEQHSAGNRKNIHDSGWQRGVMNKAAQSKCVQYFTEQKLSGTTGLKEIYVAVRIGEDVENIIGVIRGSKTAAPV